MKRVLLTWKVFTRATRFSHHNHHRLHDLHELTIEFYVFSLICRTGIVIIHI
jgi:hypothetical protein